MVPFRIFDRDKKEMWVILNYHPGSSSGDEGSYLVAREGDDDKDGEIRIFPASDLAKYRWVDFLEEGDAYGE